MRAAAPAGAVAPRALRRGDVIWEEAPLAAVQAASSRGRALACGACLACLGGANGQLALLTGAAASRAQAAAAPPAALPPLPGAPQLTAAHPTPPVPCARGCGEVFCSEACAAAGDAAGHRFLCVGPLDEQHPLYRFKCHALAAQEDSYLLAATLLAGALCAIADGRATEAEALAPLDALRCAPWWEAATLAPPRRRGADDADADVAGALRSALGEQVRASWALLRDGLADVACDVAAGRCLELHTYAAAVTACALRTTDAAVATPLRLYIRALASPRAVAHDAPQRAAALHALTDAAESVAAAEAAAADAAEVGSSSGDDDNDGSSECSSSLSSSATSSEEDEGDADVDSASEDEGPHEWGAPEASEAAAATSAALRTLRRPLRALALFRAAADVAHSCAPNCVLTFDQGDAQYASNDTDAVPAPLRATLRAACDVAAGEPLSRAWVDEDAPLEDRAAALEALGLPPCACDRCALERAASRQAPRLSAADAAAIAARAAAGCRHADAAAAWRAVLAASPGDGDAAHGLGAALLNSGDWQGAAAAWAAGVAAAPSHAALADVAAAAADFALWPAGADMAGDDVAAASSVTWREVRVGRGHHAHVSTAPLLSSPQCAAAVAEAEAAAAASGGWATGRHYSVPTTDVSLRQLPRCRAAFGAALRGAVAPRLAERYDVPRHALRVHDAFLVRYDAQRGQASLPFHADQGHFSLTLALNTPDSDFTGGGTRFADAPPQHALLSPPLGAAVLFPSRLVHAGEPITAGVRYIIAAFLWVDAPPPAPRQLGAADNSDDSASSSSADD